MGKKWEFCEQKGDDVGHCHAAQIFCDGKAAVMIEPTSPAEKANILGRHILNLLEKHRFCEFQPGGVYVCGVDGKYCDFCPEKPC